MCKAKAFTLAKQALGSKRPTYKGLAKSKSFILLLGALLMVIKTAILVDGGFYRKRAKYLWGPKSALARADELESYCKSHIYDKKAHEERYLYRVFYYDCAPTSVKCVYHPLLHKNIQLDKSETFTWSNTFLNELKKRRKFAIRLGNLSNTANYNLKPEITKKLFEGKITINDITQKDFTFNIHQKGVDTKLCLDIASLAYKKQVDQIILIAGDSDFVPAAKLARREGIDIILDPLWLETVSENLFEHIDGLKSVEKETAPN